MPVPVPVLAPSARSRRGGLGPARRPPLPLAPGAFGSLSADRAALLLPVFRRRRRLFVRSSGRLDLALELVEDSRVMGLNRVEIADLSGQGLEPPASPPVPRPRVCLRRALQPRWLAPDQRDRGISARWGQLYRAGGHCCCCATAPRGSLPAPAPSLLPAPAHAPSRHLTAAIGFQVRLSCPASLPGLRARHQIALCPAAWTWQRRLSCPNGCDRLSPS